MFSKEEFIGAVREVLPLWNERFLEGTTVNQLVTEKTFSPKALDTLYQIYLNDKDFNDPNVEIEDVAIWAVSDWLECDLQLKNKIIGDVTDYYNDVCRVGNEPKMTKSVMTDDLFHDGVFYKVGRTYLINVMYLEDSFPYWDLDYYFPCSTEGLDWKYSGRIS